MRTWHGFSSRFCSSPSSSTASGRTSAPASGAGPSYSLHWASPRSRSLSSSSRSPSSTRMVPTPATSRSSSPSHLSLQLSTSSGSSSSVAAGSSLTAKPASRLTATTTPNNPNFLKDRLSHRNGPSYHL